MSEGEPRALRTIVIVATTITVLVVAATGFLLWWLARDSETPSVPRPADERRATPEPGVPPR
jgi:hypothetical protein